MPVISVRSSLKPAACAGERGPQAVAERNPQVQRACNTYAHAHTAHTQCTRSAHAEQVQVQVPGAVQGAHQERVDDVLLRVEVGTRGLRRSGEEAAEGL